MGVESLERWLREERARGRHRDEKEKERVRKLLDDVFYGPDSGRMFPRHY